MMMRVGVTTTKLATTSSTTSSTTIKNRERRIVARRGNHPERNRFRNASRAAGTGKDDDDVFGITTSSNANKDDDGAVVVVIIPGFLSGAEAYDGMRDALERELRANARDAGSVVKVFVAPTRASDWYPTLGGKDFSRIVDGIDACVERASTFAPKDGKVVLVGHSAGGWLARLWMGGEAYCGKRYNGAKYVKTLITLGTPHASAEAYPFGRVIEKRVGEDDAALSENARGSSLCFTNELYPGAHEVGVKYVNVAGDYIRGANSFPEALCVELKYDKENLSFLEKIRRAWRAYSCGISYAANTGDSAAGVVGDGVCPIETAHSLPGAEEVILRAYHSPNTKGDPWYGSPDVVARWAPYCV
jgi:pimeloyl-ACP methyl ester carboxylesterase